MGVRPSNLYGVQNPLAAFYFDRGIYWWGNLIEGKMNEAETSVRQRMRNQKGTDVFVQSARLNMFNKLLGLNPASAYRQPSLMKPSSDGEVDLKMFNE